MKDKIDIKSLTVNELPLKADYRVLLWYGRTDGSEFKLGFRIGDIQDKRVILKSFKVYPYYYVDAEDFFVDDGVVQNAEVIPANARINRLFDEYANESARFRVIINGNPTAIFNNLNNASGYPLDLQLDNIFHLFPETIQTWDVLVNAQIFDDLQAQTTETCNVKVVCEVYLI